LKPAAEDMNAGRLIRALDDLSRTVNRVAERLVAALAMAMAGVIGLQVFFRYGLNNSLFWSEELGRMFLVWLSFLGASVAYHKGAHAGVDALVQHLGPGWQKLSRLAALTVSLVLFGAMAVYGFRFMHFIRFQSTTTLGISKEIPFAMVPISGAVLFLHALNFLFQELRRRP